MDSYGCLDPVAASVHISDKKQGKQSAWTFSNRSDFRLDNQSIRDVNCMLFMFLGNFLGHLHFEYPESSFLFMSDYLGDL